MKENNIAGSFKWIRDVEGEGRWYAECLDGLRLIFENGTYIGHYNPNLTTEG